MRRGKTVSKKINTQKRILGISAIVLALLLIMLPQFGHAERNTDQTVLEYYKTLSWLINNHNMEGITAIEWNADASDSDKFLSKDTAIPVYAKLSGEKLYVYSTADNIYTDESSNQLFGYNQFPNKAENITTIDSEITTRLNTSNTTDMRSMFVGLNSLTGLDLSSFDTSNVTDMRGMFSECSSLASLDLSNFVTSNVTNMAAMFFGCSRLETLDLSNFDTSSVTGSDPDAFYFMFKGCSALEYLDISNFTVASTANVYDMFSGCSNLNILKTPRSTAKEITLPDTYYHLFSDGTYEESGGSRVEYTTIPSGLTESITLVKVSAVPTVTPSALITLSASPSATPTATASPSATPTATASPSATPTATASPSATPTATASPSATPTVTPTPTPTPAPTQATGQGSLTIEDNRSSKTGNNQVAGTVSNLVGNLRLIIEDSAGTGLKNLIDMEEGMILVPYDIYLVDNYGNAYKNFGSCTITLPVPDSMDLTKGRLKVVAVRSSNVLENLSSSLVIKSNTNCTQFTTTHFSEFGLLYIPYTETTAMVTPTATPTPATTEAAATAAAKATAAAGGSSSKSGSSGSSSSSSSSSSGSSYKAVPVSQVSARYGGNSKDMPKTGDGDVYRILGAIILLLFGAIELVTSIPTVKKINKSENDKEC